MGQAILSEGDAIFNLCFMFLPNRSQSSMVRLSLRLILWHAVAACSALLAASCCSAQSPPAGSSEATALIRRAVANRFAEDKHHQPQRFIFHKQDERHNLTQQIIETPQGDVALLIGVNGLPIGPIGRQNEKNRLDALDANPALQEHRRRREQADSDRVDNLLRMLPDAFLYTYKATEPCTVSTPPDIPIPGAPPRAAASEPSPTVACYHMTFTPNPDWEPPSLEARVLRGMAGDAWLDVADDRLYKLDAHLVDDVDFGWGIVGRLNKGGTIYLEQTLISSHDWELTRMKMNFTGKAFMVKPISFHINEELAHFQPVPPATDYHKAIHMLEQQQSPAK